MPGFDDLLALQRQDKVEGWVLRLLGDGERLRRIRQSKDLGEGERAVAELADARACCWSAGWRTRARSTSTG